MMNTLNVDKRNMYGDNNNSLNRIIGVVFSLTFSFSVELIILMMCELIDLFDKHARLICFKLFINSLVFLFDMHPAVRDDKLVYSMRSSYLYPQSNLENGHTLLRRI